MNEGKHIVSFSGGKDSTAMLLLLLEQGKRIDEIVYYDAETWEFPQMHEHMQEVANKTGLPVTRLRSEKKFDYWFSEHIITKGQNKGSKGYGFPSVTRRWCTREKTRVINKYIGSCDVLYIGYAFDEIHRVKDLETKAKKIVYPLIEAGITEKEALQKCREYGFTWGGLYEIFFRVSCWCCPLQRKSELRKLYTHFPELWQRLQQMQDISWNSFSMDYTRIEKYAKEFEAEKKQLRLQI